MLYEVECPLKKRSFAEKEEEHKKQHQKGRKEGNNVVVEVEQKCCVFGCDVKNRSKSAKRIEDN